MSVRPASKPQLVGLAGDEALLATSVTGGDKVGGGSVAAGADVHITPDQLRDYARTIKITSTVTSNTITPDGDTDLVRPSASLAAGLTIANPATTPADGAGFVVDLIDNGTSRSLTWGSKYANRMATLPAATIAGKRHRIGVEYHAADDKLYCMYAQVEP